MTDMSLLCKKTNEWTGDVLSHNPSNIITSYDRTGLGQGNQDSLSLLMTLNRASVHRTMQLLLDIRSTKPELGYSMLKKNMKMAMQHVMCGCHGIFPCVCQSIQHWAVHNLKKTLYAFNCQGNQDRLTKKWLIVHCLLLSVVQEGEL